jgi:ABC-2 type transport system permease protein
MTHLVRGEMIKVRTTRTALGFAAATLLLVLAQVLISILADDLTGAGEKRAAIGVGGTIAILLIVFGAVGATGEFRHRTMAPAVLIAPDRVRLAIARIVAYSFTGLLVGLAAIGLALVLGLPLLAGEPGEELAGDDLVTVIVGGLAVSVLAAALGVGVGLLVRNQVAAVVGALVWLFVLEPLTGLLGDTIVDYTIGSASSQAGGGNASEALSWSAGLAVLAAWTVVFVGIGLLVDRRRDVE